MPGFEYLPRLRSAALTALLAATTGGPAIAQTGTTDCSSYSGAEEVDCLRRALAQTQEALTRAERALQTPQPAEAATEDPPRQPVTLGEEQAARRAGTLHSAEQAARVSALIVKSERVFPDQLQVHLENGQTWRQIQGDTQRVELSARTPVSAEIWRSGFGGYRMRLREVGRVLKVERIR